MCVHLLLCDKYIPNFGLFWVGGRFGRFVSDNPGSALAGLGLIAISAPILGPAVLVGGLNAAGFSAVGPVAGKHKISASSVAISSPNWACISCSGTFAAAAQSIFYGGAVASGSLFSLAQSAAMGGVVVASGAEIVAGTAALAAGVGILRRGDRDGGG